MTKGMETIAMAAATIYSFISPSHASVCRLGSPRKKITIRPIINLCMSISVTTCCFDGSIVGGQPRDIRERKHAGGGHASQISTYVPKIEAMVT